MKVWIGLGSNLGDRRENLERAAGLIHERLGSPAIEVGPIVESRAVVPQNSPPDWNRAYLNSVMGFEFQGQAFELLTLLKQIEGELGRMPSARWAPRIIDLDLLVFGDERIETQALQVPHEQISVRPFVLTPLKCLVANLKIPGSAYSVLEMSRACKSPLPLWMGIINLTADSFSGSDSFASAQQKMIEYAEQGVHYIDLGAESTRPGARPLELHEEWARLNPLLEWWAKYSRGHIFRPKLSVDTYHAETAALALECGVDTINDVSGLASPAMLDVLKQSDCQYILMHSLTVPADPTQNLLGQNPLPELLTWARAKLEVLQNAGISLDRIIFDPGLGFGKSGNQSWAILLGLETLFTLPVRILVGHSRKSMLKTLRSTEPRDRDTESLGVSIDLASRGVDILRVHDPITSLRAYNAFLEGRP